MPWMFWLLEVIRLDERKLMEIPFEWNAAAGWRCRTCGSGHWIVDIQRPKRAFRIVDIVTEFGYELGEEVAVRVVRDDSAWRQIGVGGSWRRGDHFRRKNQVLVATFPLGEFAAPHAAHSYARPYANQLTNASHFSLNSALAAVQSASFPRPSIRQFHPNYSGWNPTAQVRMCAGWTHLAGRQMNGIGFKNGTFRALVADWSDRTHVTLQLINQSLN